MQKAEIKTEEPISLIASQKVFGTKSSQADGRGARCQRHLLIQRPHRAVRGKFETLEANKKKNLISDEIKNVIAATNSRLGVEL